MQCQFRHRLLNALGVLLMGAVLTPGCGGYDEISPGAYDYAKALYSICNRRDESRLETFSARLSEARETGEVSEEEADWLDEIAGQARDGEWDDASADARRMLADQVEEGP